MPRWTFRVALALMTTAALAGCGSGTSTVGQTSAPPAPASTEKTLPDISTVPATGGGTSAAPSATSDSSYSGLGAPESAFNAQHPHGPPSPPTVGQADYTVDATNSAGLVTAFHVQVNAQPPFGDRERVALLAGSLPPGRTETNLNSDTCIVWRSATLRKLIGMEYAAATTVTGTDTAQMRAERAPHC